MQAAHLHQQSLGVGLGQGAPIGHAGVQQQGGFGGLQAYVDHQSGLAAQADQPRLTGPPGPAQSPQGAVVEAGQS